VTGPTVRFACPTQTGGVLVALRRRRLVGRAAACSTGHDVTGVTMKLWVATTWLRSLVSDVDDRRAQ
jgi:hypothetical protein